MEMEITMSRKKRKAQAAEVPDIEASGKDMYDWVQCLIVALIICVVFFAFKIRKLVSRWQEFALDALECQLL